jgi:hypothetical protein
MDGYDWSTIEPCFFLSSKNRLQVQSWQEAVEAFLDSSQCLIEFTPANIYIAAHLFQMLQKRLSVHSCCVKRDARVNSDWYAEIRRSHTHAWRVNSSSGSGCRWTSPPNCPRCLHQPHKQIACTAQQVLQDRIASSVATSVKPDTACIQMALILSIRNNLRAFGVQFISASSVSESL